MMYIYIFLMVSLFFILLPFFLYKILVKGKYVESILHRFIPPDAAPLYGKNTRIWIHAVSVGELEAARSVIRKIRNVYPDTGLILSTVTETGQAMALKKVDYVDVTCYFPLDLPFIIPSFFRRLKPELIILTETEIWPYFIRNAKNRDIPVILVNGRISKDSFKWYKKIRFFLKNTLNEMDLFLMQSSIDANRIIALGAPINKVVNIGNIKFDQVIHTMKNNKPDIVRNKYGIPEELKIIVAGSTHPGEEHIFIDAVKSVMENCKPGIVPVIAPRHLNRVPEIEEILRKNNIVWTKRTDCQDGINKEFWDNNRSNSVFYILDTLGELAQFYSMAEIVFIGGSLVPVGGHNILEPAVYGVPVCFVCFD